MNIGNHNLDTDGTYIIAEIGSNHNQSKQLAYETIDAAIECGANAVKFQSINIDQLYFGPSQKTIDLHKKIDLEESWHHDFKDYCDKKGVTFFSAPTYLSAIDLLEDLDVELYKLASAQIGTFPQLVEKVISLGKPVIFSTGLATTYHIGRVMELFHKYNNPNHIILHCNSIYPTPYEKVNLGLINHYKGIFNTTVGFSDHSDGIATAIAAVSLGAQVIEKHFAMDRKLPVPDAPFSLEPKDFKDMVDGVRIAEQVRGIKTRNEIEPEEQGFKTAITTRLILKNRVNKGDLVKEADFTFLRSPEGISCTKLYEIIDCGTRYTKDIQEIRELHESDITS